MDAAITGLIGSLGGVAIATVTQTLQAHRTRKWQIADRDHSSGIKVRDELRSERKALYVRYIESSNRTIKACQWAQLTASSTDPIDDHTKALAELNESVLTLLHVTQEVLLITENPEVSRATTTFQLQVSRFSPGIHKKGAPSAAAEWEAFQRKLVNGYQRFLDGARCEIGVGLLQLGDPSPDATVAIPASAEGED